MAERERPCWSPFFWDPLEVVAPPSSSWGGKFWWPCSGAVAGPLVSVAACGLLGVFVFESGGSIGVCELFKFVVLSTGWSLLAQERHDLGEKEIQVVLHPQDVDGARRCEVLLAGPQQRQGLNGNQRRVRRKEERPAASLFFVFVGGARPEIELRDLGLEGSMLSISKRWR
ncbi:hypothetical protein L7F22_067586 [Adiantum nelumboides]|nr:hypothetical protein [Adiantum nelumboides]